MAGALSAVGVAPAGQLGSFPHLHQLDLRRTSISPFQIAQLHRLCPGIRLLQLTYLERVGRPHEYFEQLEVRQSFCPDLALSCSGES